MFVLKDRPLLWLIREENLLSWKYRFVSFCSLIELLRSKDNDLRKILEEKSRLVAELRVTVLLVYGAN